AQALEAAGIKVERKINLGGTLIAHKALEEKQIDVYPEYTGTMLLAVLKAEPMTDQRAVYEKVRAEYATKGFVVLNEAPLNNTYNMVVLPETAVRYKLETLSDLAKVSKELKLGAGPEFRDRKDGLPGLKAKYGIEFKEDLQMAIGLRYQALASKQIDVVNGYSTDGMISALKLKRLQDDKNLWPPYYLVPVVRKEALDANPKIAEVLNRVSSTLDEAQMAEMNYKVDNEQAEPRDHRRGDFSRRHHRVPGARHPCTRRRHRPGPLHRPCARAAVRACGGDGGRRIRRRPGGARWPGRVAERRRASGRAGNRLDWCRR